MAGLEFLQVDVQGFGVFERAQSLRLDDRRLTLVVGDNRDTRSARSNGAGKSTIFKAISWALYQRTIDGLTTDVIHRRQKSAEVTLTLRVDGRRYRVRRRRTRTTGQLSLHRFEPALAERGEDEGWLEMTQQRMSQTQEAVEVLIGMDWDAFRCCVLFGQGDVARFASPTLGDAARKNVLSSVLGLERYEEARERARDLKKECDRAIDAANRSLAEVARRLHEVLEQRSFAEGRLESHRAAERSGQSQMEELDAQRRALESRATELSEALEREADALDEATVAVETTTDALERCTEAMHAARLATREAESRVDDLSDAGPCPTCGQERPFDPERLAEAQRDLTRSREELERLQQERAGAAEARSEARSTLEAARERRQALREAMGALEARRSALQSRRDEIAQSLDDARRQLQAIQDELDRHDQTRERLTEARSEREAEIEGLQGRREMAAFWIHGFGPKGVPALAIEQSLPVLNARANRHLFDLADGDLTVEWTATADKSGGGKKEELTQHITVEGIADAAPSGGQMRKIELATELALAEIVRESGKLGANILFLDEVLDGLDVEGTARVCQWLETLPMGSVFLISHNTGVSEAFDDVVCVVKEGGRARIVDRSGLDGAP